MNAGKSEGREINLTNEAGHAFLSPEAGRRIWNKELNGTNELTTGIQDNQQSPKYKNSRRNSEARDQMAMQVAIGNTGGVLMELGSLLFSSEDVQSAVNEEIEFLESQRDTMQMIQEANQDIYLRNDDGSLMSAEQIEDYENQNMVCVADPNQDQADIMKLDADLAFAHEVQQAIEAGEDVDFDQLSPSVQKILISDEIASKIEAGETIDLASIPPEHRDMAIEAVIDAEKDAQSLALYKEYGFTEQDFNEGVLFTNDEYDDLRLQFLDDRNEWRDERRDELKAEAGINDPAPEENEPKLTEEQTLEATGVSPMSP